MRQMLCERPGKVIYREGDQVLKVFGEGYGVADILNEALNQARVMETDLPVPKLLEVGRVDGRWAIRMELVEGPTLAAEMAREPQRRLEHLERLADVQIDIHRRPGGLLNSLAEKTRRKIDEASIAPAIRYELLARLESRPKGRSLLHGDLTPGNVVLAPDGRARVLDWSHASRGDQSADAARTYLSLRLSYDEQTAEDYLDLYVRKSGRKREAVQGWLPLVAAARLADGDKSERRFLTGWLDVMDFQ